MTQKLRHVAIIMDGNARWAKMRDLPVKEGHRAGSAAVRRCIDAAFKHGVRYLTLFAFSSENWRRDPNEISDLQDLLAEYLEENLPILHENAVAIKITGSLERFPQDLQDALRAAETLTQDNDQLTLTLALSYGARDEIVEAAKNIARDVEAGKISLDDLDTEKFNDYLQTRDIPDPDIIVRTSGEQRLSNFLLWQCAYAEILFLSRLWPDFDHEDFAYIVEQFGARKRRFGGRPEELEEL